jgi:hypothetical protein
MDFLDDMITEEDGITLMDAEVHHRLPTAMVGTVRKPNGYNVPELGV